MKSSPGENGKAGFDIDPFARIYRETEKHRIRHGCDAYSFRDGPALIRIAEERQPHLVLELGTALGYTACCLAHGCLASHVDTIEGNADHVLLAREQVARYGLDSRITVHHGDFDMVLSSLVSGYDLAFFDGLAPGIGIISRLWKLLKSGGVLICSNLTLGLGQETRLINEEFKKTSRWRKDAFIEHGETAVLVKT